MEAKFKPPEPPVTHKDQIGQVIEPGDYVAFAPAYTAGIRVGRVVKLTQQRVRIAYRNQWQDANRDEHISEWMYLARPDRTVVLTDHIEQELTMLKLKNLVP